MMENLIGSQSIIITLDVDAILLDRLQQVAQSGFTVVEINSIEQDLLRKVIQDFPTLRIGAGNIISTQQLEMYYQARAHFITSPGFTLALAQTASIYSINYLPGVGTLSEAMQAMTLGYNQVRPFPADLKFCTLLNKSLPQLRLYPAEIEWEEAQHFLNLPSVAAVRILNPENKQLRALSSGVLA